jgi:ATP-dependent Lon protease
VATVAVMEPTNIEDIKKEALLSVLMEKLKVLSSINPYLPPDFLRTIEDNSDIDRVADLVSSTIRLKKEQAYKLFVEQDVEKRLMQLIDFLVEEIEASKLQREIKSKAHSRIDKVNKEYFLKEQLKQIQKELGADTQRDEEIEEYRKKLELKKAYMSEDAYKEIKNR